MQITSTASTNKYSAFFFFFFWLMLKTDYLQYCLIISLGMNPDYIGLGRHTCLHDTVKGYIIK